jgi:hypothetical protein
VPSEGENPAIEQLQQAQDQPRPVEQVEDGKSQEAVGGVGQQAVISAEEPNLLATKSTTPQSQVSSC